MKRDEQRTMRERLEPRLEVFRRAARQNVLQSGWLKDLRQALGIPAAEVAHRLKTSRAWVYRAEQDERNGWITLQALDEAAHAMGCRVVYGIVPYRDEGLNELAQSLKDNPRRETPRIVAKREKKVKKVWDGTEEWHRKQEWERVADQKAAEVRQRIMDKAKSYNYSVDAAMKAEETAGSNGGVASPGAAQEPKHAPVPRTAEEMRRMGVGGAEALRAALAERLRK